MFKLTSLLLVALVASKLAIAEGNISFSNAQAAISYTKTNCIDQPNGIEQEKLLFTFTNKTNKNITISFERKAVYEKNGKAIPTSSDHSGYTIQLLPNQVISGTCETKDNRLVLFSKQLNLVASQLQAFDISNVKIEF